MPNQPRKYNRDQITQTPEEVAATIASFLEARDWTQSRLADELGCSQAAVSKWIKGEKYPRAYWQKLIDLGVPLGDLFTAPEADESPTRISDLPIVEQSAVKLMRELRSLALDTRRWLRGEDLPEIR